jgi:hypothetical protein
MSGDELNYFANPLDYLFGRLCEVLIQRTFKASGVIAPKVAVCLKIDIKK